MFGKRLEKKQKLVASDNWAMLLVQGANICPVPDILTSINITHTST
jgi:hypothetical protein